MEARNNNSASRLLLLYWRDCGNTGCYEQGSYFRPLGGEKYLVITPPHCAHNVKSMHVLAGQEVMMCVREILPYAGMP